MKNKYYAAMLMFLAFIIPMSGCGNITTNNASKNEETEAETTVLEETETTENDNFSNYVCDRSGSFSNEHFSIEFMKDVFVLIEQYNVEDENSYYYSLLPADGTEYSFPRIDVMSIDTSSITEEVFEQNGQETMNQDFGEFCEYLLQMYYPNVEINGEEVSADIETLSNESTISIEDGETIGKAIITVEAQEDREMPQMKATIEMYGRGENGFIKIMFCPLEMSDETNDIMNIQFKNVFWKG